MTQARPPAGRKKKWPWVAGAAGSVVLIAGAVSAGKPAEEAVIQPAAAVVETSVSTTTVTTTVISTSVVTSPVTQTVTAEPSPVTVTVTAAAAAAVEAPATPAPAPLAAIPSTTKAPTTSAKPEPASGGSTYYKNCAAVWAAGKAPIHAGDPGYSTDLDGDSDGVGCEKPPR